MISFEDFMNEIKMKCKENEISTLLTASYEITNDCNMSCVHCYNRDIINNKKNISLSKKLEIINKIYSMGIVELVICGGEPFLDKDIIKIIDECKKLGIRIVILTNGILLNEDMIFELEKRLGRYDVIQVSYDELKSNKITTQRKLNENQILKLNNNIKLLQNSNLNVEYNITITSLNQNDVENIFNKLVNLGAKKIGSTPYVPLGGKKYDLLKPDYDYLMRINEVIKKIAKINNCNYLGGIDGHVCQRSNKAINKKIKMTKKFRECTAAEFKFHVKSNGDIYPCVFMTDVKFKLGNIFNLDYEFNERMKSIKNSIKSSLPLKCNSCELIEECQGGCPGLIYDRYKELNRVDPRCIN